MPVIPSQCTATTYYACSYFFRATICTCVLGDTTIIPKLQQSINFHSDVQLMHYKSYQKAKKKYNKNILEP